jgi:hypothetical protein
LYNVKQCFGFVTDSQAILTALQKGEELGETQLIASLQE